jgi:hypothetical protein
MKARRLLISVFIAFHLSALGLTAFPPFSDWREEWGAPFQRYLRLTGLWQEWGMFSPEPMRTNVHVEALIRFRDGKTAWFTLPRMHREGLIDRIVLERYRKWIQDWLRLDREHRIWVDAAKFIARQIPTAPGNPVLEVGLFRVWHDIEDPQLRFREWGYRIPDRELSRARFFTYYLNPEGGSP